MWKKSIIVFSLSTATLAAGTETVFARAGGRQAAAESTQQAAATDTLLQDTRAQIARAEVEHGQASSESLKMLIAVRLAILRNTEAMLEQKKFAVEQGITLIYTVEGAVFRPDPPDAELIAGLSAAIADTETRIDVAIAQVATQTDIAVRATVAAGIATLENTLAMLRQRRYAATFSIPYVGPETGVPAAAAAPSPPPVTKDRPIIAGGVEMVEIDLRISDMTTTWWEMSWWLTLKNTNNEDVRVHATIQFLDAEGHLVTDEEVPDLLVPAGQEQVFQGEARVDVLIAPRVKSIYAKIQYTRD